MTDRLYAPLRGALETLADGDAPPDLAATALRRANRRRVATRTLGVVTAAAAVVAAVPAVLAAVGPSSTAPHVGAAAPAAGSVVAAYQRVDPDGGATDPGPANDSTLLLNFSTGRYALVPYPVAVPSPDYRRAAVSAGDNSAAHPSRWGVLDLATNAVRWLPDNALRGYEQYPAWSPDSRSFALAENPRTGPAGIRLVNAETLAETFLPTDSAGDAETGLGGNVTFTADGAELVVVLTHGGPAGGTVTAIRYYGLDGTVHRTVPAAPIPADATIVSPDARLVLAVGPATTVLNAQTGTVISTFGGAGFAWYDATHYLTTAGDRTNPLWQIVDATTGQAVRTVTARPPGAPADFITPVIRSADGLNPTGAAFIF
jgi:hypothetical protein